MRWALYGLWVGLTGLLWGQGVTSQAYGPESRMSISVSASPSAVVWQGVHRGRAPLLVLSTGDTIQLAWDEDGWAVDGRWFTFPVVLPPQVRWIRPLVFDTGTLYEVAVPPAPWVETALGGAGGICDPPAWIPPSQWRAGLTPPAVKPAATPTHHVIVHHSASNLTDSNYVAVVRSIYLYHTQVRGWDDIGYNFVIDPAGVLYQARDPQGVDDPDHIKGAHFCGKNSYTMGVCLLGNYQQARPSAAALNTLNHLLTWKMHKEGLNPLDSMLHPVGSSSAVWLPVIAPHRAGCATLCPGDSVAVRMPAIRQAVADSLQQCLPATLKNPPVHWPPLPVRQRQYDVWGRFLGVQRTPGVRIQWIEGRGVRKVWERRP